MSRVPRLPDSSRTLPLARLVDPWDSVSQRGVALTNQTPHTPHWTWQVAPGGPPLVPRTPPPAPRRNWQVNQYGSGGVFDGEVLKLPELASYEVEEPEMPLLDQVRLHARYLQEAAREELDPLRMETALLGMTGDTDTSGNECFGGWHSWCDHGPLMDFLKTKVALHDSIQAAVEAVAREDWVAAWKALDTFSRVLGRDWNPARERNIMSVPMTYTHALALQEALASLAS